MLVVEPPAGGCRLDVTMVTVYIANTGISILYIVHYTLHTIPVMYTANCEFFLKSECMYEMNEEAYLLIRSSIM